MVKVLRPGYRRRSLTGGVAFMYFSLLALPTMMFGAGLATDFTRIIQAGRQVANATQAAALGGAQQFVPNSVALDSSKATQAAADTYCVAIASNELSRSQPGKGNAISCSRGGSAPVSIKMGGDNGDGKYQTISVTARYVVNGLIFTKYFGADSTLTAQPITRTASVCVPDDPNGPTNGHCIHPSSGGS